ncbi:MAG: hypothetical protein C5S33_08580 [ANME-2 cluster archaeon]|jgi:hypothetical protein|nr:hypothetical protein [ANME-2 cluster archaeon]
MGCLVIYLCEKCQYLFDLKNRQGDSQDGRAAMWDGLLSVWLYALIRGWTSKNREKYW